ncbi:hypothetical protein [Streptacidiphilus cavernicola]|uniref:Uncharacterized protein n=1 Tax=Streptacidiphilus cavernicola TaxID=3342716 RepID=A0ABV6W679_9ACTN
MTRIDDGLGGPSAAGAGTLPDEERSIWLDIPEGYSALPLRDLDETVPATRRILAELSEPEQRPLVELTVGTLGVLLQDLADRSAVYCGIGRHASAVDGGEVTSTLVVSVQDTEAAGDPRLLLGEMVERLAAEDWQGQADLLDVVGRPVLFCERVQELPAPQLPGGPELPDDATAPVFLLEALVPSDDGTLLAAIEFATPYLDNGPEFRTMMATLAAALSFDPPREDGGDQGSAAPGQEPTTRNAIRDALG